MMVSSIKSGLCALLAACLVVPGLSLCRGTVGVESPSFVGPLLPPELTQVLPSPAMMPILELLDQIPVSPMPSREDWFLMTASSASSPSVSLPSAEDLRERDSLDLLGVCLRRPFWLAHGNPIDNAHRADSIVGPLGVIPPWNLDSDGSNSRTIEIDWVFSMGLLIGLVQSK